MFIACNHGRGNMLTITKVGMVTTVAAALVAAAWSLPAVADDIDQDQRIHCWQDKYTHTQPSLLHTTTVFNMSMSTSGCEKQGQFVVAGMTCKITDVDPILIEHTGCERQTNFYGWSGNIHGGFHAQASAVFGNCIFRLGCLSHGTLTMETWMTSNGAISHHKDVG